MKKILAGVMMGGALVIGVAGCGQSPQTGTSQSETGVSGNAKGTGKVQITLWDQYTASADAKVMNTIISNFEKIHPNIKIVRTAMQDQSMQTVIKPALESHKGPDIFMYDVGPGYTDVLAKDGLLLDLTSFAKSHSWYNRFPKWLLSETTFNGKLYGIGNEQQALGVFYNKSIFQKYNLSVPKTYSEFLADCQALKSHGVTPLEVMDKDQWEGFHYESSFFTSFAGRTAIENVLDQKASAGWNQPVFASALNNLHELVAKGYTNPDPLGVSYDDGNKAFYAGKAAMDLTGSWIVGDMYKNLGKNVGFFPLPPNNPNWPDIAPGGLGGAMLVSRSTAHPTAVEEFLDYMFSNKTASLWLGDNMIPPMTSVNVNKLKGANPLFKQVIGVIDNPQGMSYSLDVLMPQQVNNVTQNDIQEVLAGKMTGEQEVADKEQAFKKAIASGDYN